MEFFHLLLEVDRLATARILQSLLTGYVWRFNKTHPRRGHLFEALYKAMCAIGIAKCALGPRSLTAIEFLKFIASSAAAPSWLAAHQNPRRIAVITFAAALL